MLLFAVAVLSVLWILLAFFNWNRKIVFTLKWTIAYVIIWMLKRKKSPTFSHNYRSNDIRHVGITSTPESWTKELPQSLASNAKDADTLGFSGVDNFGNALITRIARRHDRKAEVVVYMKSASGEEYQLPIQPDVHVVNTDGKTFSAGGLTYELLEPLRRWRVSFNGMLRKSTDKTWSADNEVVEVRFSFVWSPLYLYVAIPDKINVSLLSTMVASMQWTLQFLKTCLIFPEEWYEQSGVLNGTVTIEDKPEFSLLLRGFKDRKHSIQDWSLPERKISIRGYLTNGLAFHIYGEENWSGINNFVHGYAIRTGNLSVDTVSDCSLNVSAVLDDCEPLKNILFRFTADSCEYLLLAKETDFGFTVYRGDNWEQEMSSKLATVKLNGNVGYGFVEYRRPHEGPCLVQKQTSVPLLAEPDIHETEKLLVNLNELESRSSRIVGGKGASLGLLTAVSATQTEHFIVPQGFCITNYAFQQHLNEHPQVVEAIHRLEEVAWKRKEGSMPDECTKVVNAIVATEISEKLNEALRGHLKTNFPNLDNESFAIRSSAIGEDSEELSAAGQNETYLGVKGFSEILKAVLKCWASQFSFRSVEYRRQYGQLLNGGMGVVVQLMVPSDVAGVLFTRDPRTGSPAFLNITANYGLGESVVAAAADPDTIILKRAWNDDLSIHRKDIGNKNMKIIMSESGGTVESKMSDEESSRCTLSDELCIKLAKISIYLEKCFGNARDNEWAVYNNQIYLLQSRPVTSDSPLTDFEVLHEFQGPFRTDYEQYTTANIGEVFPGAVTPLSITGTLRSMEYAFAKQQQGAFSSGYDPTIPMGVVMLFNHTSFDRVQQKAWSSCEKKDNMTKAMELGFYGRVLDDNDTLEIASERYKKMPLLMRFMMSLFSMKGMAFGPWIVKRYEKNFRHYSIPVEDTVTPIAAYERIEEHMLDVQRVVVPHMYISMASTSWNLIMLNIMSNGSGEFGMDHYADFALLIGGCNGAESGTLPFKLQELAEAISREIQGELFSSMSPDEAMKWLEKNKGDVLERFQEFLRRHGHRGYQEFEMRTITWGMDPLKLVIVLQSILKNTGVLVAKETKGDSIHDAIAKMKTPIKGIKRKLLALVLHITRKYVCYREQTKSMMINLHHALRKSYHHLATLMVESGFIPDADLMFFLTHEEIGQLIQTRSPRLIRRAKRRRHHYNYMDSLQLPEMINGYPKLEDDSNNELTDSEGLVEVKGYPACLGVVQGVARVIKTFDEVHTIERGDILITYATDIGWSPYFPLLSGVATEIGGLISHGAVVAREYGLPCLICVVNATKVFKSGDIVKLDANKGILQKIY